MSWTLPADVTAAWIGDGVPTNTAQIQIWIDKAEREILFRVPDIQTRIDAAAAATPASTALLKTAVDVTVAMVTRVFRNPEGTRSRNTTSGPFTDTVTYGGDQPGVLGITDEEMAKLRGDIVAGGAFTVDMIPVSSRFSSNYVPTTEWPYPW